MPNHVANVIKMEGIKNLPLFSVGDDGEQYFDFNKLIPMAESLNIESGSSTEESIVYFLTEKCTIPIGCLEDSKKEMLKKLVDNMFCKGELVWAQEIFLRVMQRMYSEKEYRKSKMYEDGKTYISNYQSYGYTTWYDWCRNKWEAVMPMSITTTAGAAVNVSIRMMTEAIASMIARRAIDAFRRN